MSHYLTVVYSQATGGQKWATRYSGAYNYVDIANAVVFTHDSTKVVVDGIGTDGKATHNEWTGKYDGKDYPLTGDPSADSRSYKKINANTSAPSA